MMCVMCYLHPAAVIMLMCGRTDVGTVCLAEDYFPEVYLMETPDVSL